MGVIIDAEPCARHATLLLIRSHYSVSTLSPSLINDTLPSFKSTKLQTEGRVWTAQLIHSAGVVLNYQRSALRRADGRWAEM